MTELRMILAVAAGGALGSVVRYLVEFVRFHDQQSNPLTGPFSTEQWISLAMVALGIAYWLFARNRQAITRVSTRAAPPAAERV